MNKCEIDFEKDYLAIHTDNEGKFRYFRWYPAEKVTQDQIEAQVIKFNEEQKEKGEAGRPAILVTDPLIRSLCAYREHASKYEELIEEAKEVQESIDTAVEYLESALADLNRIRGLD